ncbi:transcription elongation factor B polypeptide 3-like [Pecten maximus]|uniref:transcription elongation factor B polypeptide 3-like n=1 Tax=Pecten maximus TaxID=6579 RepID=UPI0014587922|nr:transcription elongation factor B polypeptide 3-like [Pecten maximus]
MATSEKSHFTTEADVEHKVLKYKSYLETNPNGNKVLYIFTRLSEMWITIAILQKTGIGKVVNNFRKKDGEIGQLAKDIVAKWKSMVALRLEAEEEARESANQVNGESESGSELEPDNKDRNEDSQSDNGMLEEEEEEIKNVDSSSDAEERNFCRVSDDERKVVAENVQKDKIQSDRHQEKDHRRKKLEEHKDQNSDRKHKSSDSKHKGSDSKHKGSDSKHKSSDKYSELKNKTEEKKHKREEDEKKVKKSEKKNNGTESINKSSESSHKSSKKDDRHSHTDRHSKQQDKLPEKEEGQVKSSESQKPSFEKKADSEKSESSSASRRDEPQKDGHHMKSETSKNVISALDTLGLVSSKLNDTLDSKADSDDDPLHWEMLESLEQEKASPRQEKLWNPKVDVNSHSIICDSQKLKDSGKKHVSQVLTDSKVLAKERDYSKEHDSKHKHKEKSSKSHHSGQKECSTEREKQHHDESSHKHKHSKHKHKHSDTEKEHKHSKRDKSDRREIISGKKESEKQAPKDEDYIDKGQSKEKERSSILESLSSEVDQGTFAPEDVPGLWFLNSKNNSFLAGKEDAESSKLEVPCESSSVKVDSCGNDKKQDSINLSDKTSENDKKDRKKHKHSKDRESSSKKHKSHKDSKSRHDSKHHSKKRKHSCDDDSKSSKARRTSSQDGMSFEDLLTAGASDANKSQAAKLSQNDYAKLKSKFKVKKKGEDDSAKKDGSKLKMQVTEDEILGALPQPNTHYRPWRLKDVEEKKKTEEELLDEFIAGTKTTGRTQMYSGKKQNFVPEVYKLFDMCMTVLCNNIDSLEFVGGVPFDILKPVLEKCTAAQLYRLEDFNPHFLEDTDPLWMSHCHKEFRLSKPEEMETWREHYLRKFDEREEKLKKISANITASMAKKVPERTTQLAYIDSAAKPPRNVRRQQAKYGTAGPSSGERSRARFLPSMDPIPIGRSGSKAVKTSAPMMAKTLTMIKKMRR